MKYTKPEWAVKQIVRENGLVEDICEHGVGHPNKEYMKQHKNQSHGIHGCCGCCAKKGDKNA